MRADVLEERIWYAIRSNVLEDPTYLRALLTQQTSRTEQAVEQFQRDHKLYMQQLAALNREAAQWERAYAGEVIALERFRFLMADVESRKSMTQERLQEIEDLLSDQQTGQDQTIYALQFLDSLPSNPQDIPEKRRILEAIHLVVVVRHFQQVRLFFELPKHEHAAGDEYIWRGPDTWQSIDWSEHSTPITPSLVHELTERR